MSDTIDVKDMNHKHVYDILFERDFSGIRDALKIRGYDTCKVCIVTDSNVDKLYYKQLSDALSDMKVYKHIFTAGESNKTLDTVSDIYETLITNHFERGDLLIALGGGVVGDICGYAAATYLRGIDYIQIPTSLLAQVDSSIGGKTGVDFRAYKNMVGAFKMPGLVYINVSTLTTLPDREFSSGMGEIIKHGLIADKEYYNWIRDHHDSIMSRDLDSCEYMIYKSDCIKAEVVEEDPYEHGCRRLLNFGHTLGHAIEKNCNFALAHGACVGLGVITAMYISAKRGYITESELSDAVKLLQSFGIPTSISDIDIDKTLADTKNDKKMHEGHVRFILLSEIGKAEVDETVTDSEMRGALESIYEK